MVEIACCKFQWSLITALLCIIKLYKCLNCRETPIILPCNSRVHDFAPTTIFFKRLLFRKWLRRLRGRCVRAKQAHLNAGSTVCDIGFRSKKKKKLKKKKQHTFEYLCLSDAELLSRHSNLSGGLFQNVKGKLYLLWVQWNDMSTNATSQTKCAFIWATDNFYNSISVWQPCIRCTGHITNMTFDK